MSLQRIHLSPRPGVTFCNMLILLQWGLVSTSSKTQAEGRSIVECPRLSTIAAIHHMCRPSSTSSAWARTMTRWQEPVNVGYPTYSNVSPVGRMRQVFTKSWVSASMDQSQLVCVHTPSRFSSGLYTTFSTSAILVTRLFLNPNSFKIFTSRNTGPYPEADFIPSHPIFL